MSDVKRYAAAGDGIVRNDEHGPLVMHSDYARLKAEVGLLKHKLGRLLGAEQEWELVEPGEYARLKAEVERLTAELEQAECDHDNCQRRKVSIDNHRLDLFTENKTLKAEVERLRKAGDGLYKSMLEIGCNEMADNFQYDDWWGSMRAWNAAKEGKPSV